MVEQVKLSVGNNKCKRIPGWPNQRNNDNNAKLVPWPEKKFYKQEGNCKRNKDEDIFVFRKTLYRSISPLGCKSRQESKIQSAELILEFVLHDVIQY